MYVNVNSLFVIFDSNKRTFTGIGFSDELRLPHSLQDWLGCDKWILNSIDPNPFKRWTIEWSDSYILSVFVVISFFLMYVKLFVFPRISLKYYSKLWCNHEIYSLYTP